MRVLIGCAVLKRNLALSLFIISILINKNLSFNDKNQLIFIKWKIKIKNKSLESSSQDFSFVETKKTKTKLKRQKLSTV